MANTVRSVPAPCDDYIAVAVSQTDKPLTQSGSVSTSQGGDHLDRLVIQVATAAQAAVTIKDGVTTVYSFATSPGGGIGTYSVPLGIRSKTGVFTITTGSGVTVMAIGKFSP